MYLHNRPRGVILHCLDRISRSSKYAPESVYDIHTEQGTFEVEKTAGGRHTVKFGIDTPDEMPSCTCRDWQRHHIPCKHFFAVFHHRSDWPWERLPSTYQESAYLSMDTLALEQHFHISTRCSARIPAWLIFENKKDIRTSRTWLYNQECTLDATIVLSNIIIIQCDYNLTPLLFNTNCSSSYKSSSVHQWGFLTPDTLRQKTLEVNINVMVVRDQQQRMFPDTPFTETGMEDMEEQLVASTLTLLNQTGNLTGDLNVYEYIPSPSVERECTMQNNDSSA